MAQVITLARNVAFFINTGTDAVPVWTEIKGLVQHSWNMTKNDADITTYDSDGWNEHVVASRAKGVTLTGKQKEDVATATRDPGQLACETTAEEVGYNAMKKFKMSFESGRNLIGVGSIQVTPSGGGNDDPNAWEAVINFSGKPVLAAA